MQQNPISSLRALALASVLIAIAGSARAHAQAPIPVSETPGMIGGQTVGVGRLVLGAASGFPETQFRMIYGLGPSFDVGVFAGATLRGGSRISGLRQGYGLDFQVPLRLTVLHLSRAAMALRLAPYVRVGESAPSFGAGATIGPRFGIALPKILSLVVGAEARLGYGHVRYGQDVDSVSFFEGAAYGVLGLETCLREQRWFVNLELDGGATFASQGMGGGGLFNVLVGFGYSLR